MLVPVSYSSAQLPIPPRFPFAGTTHPDAVPDTEADGVVKPGKDVISSTCRHRWASSRKPSVSGTRDHRPRSASPLAFIFPSRNLRANGPSTKKRMGHLMPGRTRRSLAIANCQPHGGKLRKGGDRLSGRNSSITRTARDCASGEKLGRKMGSSGGRLQGEHRIQPRFVGCQQVRSWLVDLEQAYARLLQRVIVLLRRTIPTTIGLTALTAGTAAQDAGEPAVRSASPAAAAITEVSSSGGSFGSTHRNTPAMTSPTAIPSPVPNCWSSRKPMSCTRM